MAKHERYTSKATGDSVEGIDNLANKLSSDLRRNIRSLGSYPIMSPPWLLITDIFARIAGISEIESNLAPAKDKGTLWETEEQAIRFIIEDGKLNLCLRSMIDYKAYQRFNLKSNAEMTDETVAEGIKFEKSLGIVLKNAWQHVEALQTSDITILLTHITDTFEFILVDEVIMIPYIRIYHTHMLQEILCYNYLRSILQYVTQLNESRIMTTIREKRLFLISIQALLKLYTYLDSDQLLLSCHAISLITDTEDFETYREQYIQNIDEVEYLIQLKTICITPILSLENKKLLRPLLDNIDKHKRIYKLK